MMCTYTRLCHLSFSEDGFSVENVTFDKWNSVVLERCDDNELISPIQAVRDDVTGEIAPLLTRAPLSSN